MLRFALLLSLTAAAFGKYPKYILLETPATMNFQLHLAGSHPFHVSTEGSSVAKMLSSKTTTISCRCCTLAAILAAVS